MVHCEINETCVGREDIWNFKSLILRRLENIALSNPSSEHGICFRRLRLKCDGTRTEIRFRLSAKRASSFKSAGASVHSTTGSQGVRISGSNAGYTTFRGSAKSANYPLPSPVSPSLPFPCVTVCHHISTGLYPQYYTSSIP